ncbi:MAG: hypothetical protein U5K00_03750 [Melioribacteraceae bacterium]|nr:hypothetical protein [Melioribacteraceae bacterium]
MDQKKLYKTLDSISSGRFITEEDMLTEVLKQVVTNEQIEVTGGRIWKLDKTAQAYSLIFQTGDVQTIPKDFKLTLKDYPVFNIVTKERTVLADETNQLLKSKGIFRYSASGVGPKIKSKR